ncbi:MAG: hypothetical protein ABF969_12010 [Sporolactobacillus sp.]
MEYEISIPEYIWHKGDRFREYVAAYLQKNEPDMKPVRIKRQQKLIVCVKKFE